MDEKRCPKCGHDLCQAITPRALMDAVATLPHGPIFKAAWIEWVGYRAQKRAKLTDVTSDRQLKMLAALPEQQAVACLDLSITNGWTGLFPDKVKPGAGFKTRGQAEMDHVAATVADTLRKRGAL